MTHRVRNMKIGQQFILNRTGQRYTLLERRHETPGGTVYVVLRSGHAVPTSLHHACHVSPIDTPPVQE